MSDIKTLDAKTCRQVRIAIFVAFVLFGLTLNSCKKCGKDRSDPVSSGNSGKTGDSTSATGGGGVGGGSSDGSDKAEELTSFQKVAESFKVKMEEMRDEAEKQARVAQAEITTVINENEQASRKAAGDRAKVAFENIANYKIEANGAYNKAFTGFNMNEVLLNDAKGRGLLELALRTKQEMEVWIEAAESAKGTVEQVIELNEGKSVDRACTAMLGVSYSMSPWQLKGTKAEACKARDNARTARDIARTLRGGAKGTDDVIAMFNARLHAWKARAQANRAKEAAERVDRKLLTSPDAPNLRKDIKDIDDAAREAGELADEAERVAGLKK